MEEKKSRGGEKGPRKDSPVSEDSPRVIRCSLGSLSSCPSGGSRPSSKLTRYFGYGASDGHGDARYPPDVSPVQKTPRQFAHLHRMLDPVLSSRGRCTHTVYFLHCCHLQQFVSSLWLIYPSTWSGSLEFSIFEFSI
uniref:Uncharacterized protein n=1 Tax=Rousettus aegyptiacus TaxID=9407 RepID=A0A7J8C2P4_ROUAE|nr:hypothetical protein HJG63_009400 [Rousettus aegyptiacus]